MSTRLREDTVQHLRAAQVSALDVGDKEARREIERIIDDGIREPMPELRMYTVIMYYTVTEGDYSHLAPHRTLVIIARDADEAERIAESRNDGKFIVGTPCECNDAASDGVVAVV